MGGRKVVSLVNLNELIKFHPYHIHTFAGFANVTQDLLEAALTGEDELTLREVYNIARYVGIPFNVLICPSLIKLSKSRYRHRKMVELLHKQLYIIWDAEKEGNKAAMRYMEYKRTHLVNLLLDFQNLGEVTYCRYLGIKEEIEQCLSFIETERRKPRERENKMGGYASVTGGTLV